MDYERYSTAIIFDESFMKDCLIYFDKVIPLYPYGFTSFGLEPRKKEVKKENLIYNSIPNDLQKEGTNFKFYDKFIHSNIALCNLVLAVCEFEPGYTNKILSHPEIKKYYNARNMAFTSLNQHSNNFKQGVFVSFNSNKEIAENENVCLTLMKLNLVKTDTITYEKIVELRKDKKSIGKLRNLRLFFYQNYNGKPKTFIEDDLLKRLQDYEETSKCWDLKTGVSTLNAFISSKMLMTSLIISLTSAYFGNIPISAISASSGITIEIGKLILNITKENLEKHEELRKDPISFLYELELLK